MSFAGQIPFSNEIIDFGYVQKSKVPVSTSFTPSVRILGSSILARGSGLLKANKSPKKAFFKHFGLLTILTARVAKRLFLLKIYRKWCFC